MEKALQWAMAAQDWNTAFNRALAVLELNKELACASSEEEVESRVLSLIRVAAWIATKSQSKEPEPDEYDRAYEEALDELEKEEASQATSSF